MAHCRICKTKDVVRLSSLETVWCPNCRRYSDWRLKDGQQSILIEGKVGNEQELLGTEKTVVRGDGEPS